MLVMTAKVNKKKIAIGLAAAVFLIVAAIMLLGEPSTPTGAAPVSTNDGRVSFLKGFGWEVNASPTESSQVKIPAAGSTVFDRYNTLQKSQGYDLTPYAGKTVMRYVYRITNYPGATEPVYATLLVYRNEIIGGDVTDTAAKGVIHGFKMPSGNAAPQSAAPQPTTPQPTTSQTTPSE